MRRTNRWISLVLALLLALTGLTQSALAQDQNLTGAQTAENVKHIIGLKPDAYILKSTTREVLLGYIADVFHKIGERMALQSELTTARNMAYKDPLTGGRDTPHTGAPP